MYFVIESANSLTTAEFGVSAIPLSGSGGTVFGFELVGKVIDRTLSTGLQTLLKYLLDSLHNSNSVQ